MKTEEDARKTWCPFARSMINEGVIANRFGDGVKPKWPYDCACIASDCSQWEEGEIREERRVYRDSDGKFPADYTRVSPSGFAVYRGEPWIYEHSNLDVNGQFDLLHRSAGKGGECGQKRSRP